MYVLVKFTPVAVLDGTAAAVQWRGLAPFHHHHHHVNVTHLPGFSFRENKKNVILPSPNRFLNDATFERQFMSNETPAKWAPFRGKLHTLC